MDQQTRDENERERADLKRQRELLECGQMGTGGKALGSSTAESLAEVNRRIAVIEQILAGKY